MKLSKSMGLATALFIVGFGQANALTIDFSAYAPGPLSGSSLVTPNATVSSSSTLFNLSGFFGGGQGGSICPFISASFNCQADLAINFTNPIKNLTFNSYGFDPGDKALISLFNGASLLATLSGYTDQLLDFTANGTITKITIKNQGNGAGYAYGAFKFDAVSTVPVPAALPLFATAIAGIGLASRRRKAKR
jgi:hypothetical protein